MKKVIPMLAAVLCLFSACTAHTPQMLYVTDEIDALPEGSIKYQISLCLPEGTTEAAFADNGDFRMYEAPDGSWFVTTQIMQNCTAQEAIRRMTGFSPEALALLCTQSMSMPEYRFSWCSEGENGLMTCTGIVAEDKEFCYCLSFCAEEAAAKDCAKVRETVMSGFGLYYDEGF